MIANNQTVDKMQPRGKDRIKKRMEQKHALIFFYRSSIPRHSGASVESAEETETAIERKKLDAWGRLHPQFDGERVG